MDRDPIGNLASAVLIRRLGSSRALVVAATISVPGIVAMPVLGAPGTLGAVGLIISSFVHCVGAFSPTSLTLRQTQTPPELLGRVAAVQRFLLWGEVALGFLLAAAATALAGPVAGEPGHQIMPG